MSESPQSSGDTALLAEVRDALARPFAESVAARLPQVLELVEQQLATTPERDKWKPLKGAIQLLEGIRPGFGPRVVKEVSTRFDAKLNPADDAFGKTARFSLDSLSLVDDSAVQEEIVLGNTTKRLRDQLGDELFALTQRLASVMGKENLPDDRNPAYPRIFARGLMDALHEPGSDSGARLAAFSAFNPFMLEVVDEIYRAANRMMRERGVLPDFKRSYGAPVQAPTRMLPSDPTASYPGARGAGGGRGGAGTGGGGALDRLIATAEGRAIEASMPPTARPVDGMVTIQIRPELVDALRKLESHLDLTGSPASSASSASAPQPAPRSMPPAGEMHFPASSAAVHRAKAEMGDALTTADAVVADLVAALFDRLYVDPRLSDATKAQVGRLQIPVFKSVMQDRAFFTDRKHPIRLLIDVIAELGGGDETILVEKRSPSQWIVAVVEDLLSRHAEHAAAFAAAHRKLAGVLERHRESAIEHDEQIRAIRAAEASFVAVREASLAIAHRLTAGSYPEEGASFLYRSWRDVLVHDYRNGGDQSPNWNADLEVLDDTLWILTPRTSKEDRARLVSLLPSLLFRLKMGFNRAGIAAEAGAAYVEELKLLLDEIVRAPVAAAHGNLRKTSPQAPVFSDDYTATLHTSSASLAEEGFVRGAWMEFKEDGARRRCRLTWLSPVQGTCLFKDLERNRSFAISLEELRERRRQGTAALVDGPGVAQSSVEGAIADVAKALGSPV